MKLIDIIILIGVALTTFGVIFYIYKQNKLGGSCSSGCGACPLVKSCNSKKNFRPMPFKK